MIAPTFQPYATDSKERERLPLWFAAIAVAASYGLHGAAEHLKLSLPWYLDLWDPIALYALVYGAFARWAWRWPLLRTIGLVKIPDLNGHYTGQMTTSFDNRTVSRPCKFEIRQT